MVGGGGRGWEAAAPPPSHKNVVPFGHHRHSKLLNYFAIYLFLSCKSYIHHVIHER